MTRTLVAALVTLGDPGRLTGGYLYHQRIAERALRHNARIIFVSFRDYPFPLATVTAPTVLRQVRSAGAQAIVLDSIAAAFLGPWLTLAPTSLPVLGMLHQPPGGIDHGPPRSVVQAGLDRLAYRRAHCLMVASDSLADQMQRQGWPQHRLVVVPPGRDITAAVEIPAADLRQGRRCALLCVGNWVERKGIMELLEAVAQLPASAATLHLAGDSDAQPAYGRRVRLRLAQPDLADRVIVHGPLSRDGVASLYAATDAFVLPSIREPYGTVYGEAMAFGLPVVGWCAGNLPYLASNEREGLLLPTGDVRGLSRALARLADDEALRRSMGEAARQRAQGRPTWDESAARFFATLRRVVESQSSSCS